MKAVADTSPAHAGPVRAAQAPPRVSLRRGNIARGRWAVFTAAAMAESMSAEAAQRFVTGKLFAFSCFEGSRGLGQIYSDGSVIATIKVRGSGPVRSFGLPPGTFKVKGDAVCATLKGLSFEP